MNPANRIIAFNIIHMTLGLVGLFYLSWWVLPIWFLVAIGNGTVGHRYFGHNNFAVSRVTHWVMCFWCTLAAYAPPLYWMVQHRHHHRHTDQAQDAHSPVNGFFMSLMAWSFVPSRVAMCYSDRACVVSQIKGLRDSAIKFTNDYFIAINIVFLAVLYLIDSTLMWAACVAYMLDHLRLGLINSVGHMPSLPGNYRNYDTNDQSQNNIFLGLITLGGLWHNNHHAKASDLIQTHKWWEVDIEGWVGNLLRRL